MGSLHGRSSLLSARAPILLASPVAAECSGEERQGGTRDGERASRMAPLLSDRPALPVVIAGGRECDYEAAGWERGEGENAELPNVMAQRVETYPVGDWFEVIGTIQPMEDVGVPNPVREAAAQSSRAPTWQSGAEMGVWRQACQFGGRGRCGA